MKNGVLPLSLLILMAGCGGEVPLDGDAAEAGESALAKGERRLRCVFHQPPWTTPPTAESVIPISDYDLRDDPGLGAPVCERTQSRGAYQTNTQRFDRAGHVLLLGEDSGGSGVGMSFSYDHDGRVLTEDFNFNGHAGGSSRLRYSQEGALVWAEFRNEEQGSASQTLVSRSPTSSCASLEYDVQSSTTRQPGVVQSSHRIERYDRAGWPVSINVIDPSGKTTFIAVPRSETAVKPAGGYGSLVLARTFLPTHPRAFASEYDQRGRLVRRTQTTLGREVSQTLQYRGRSLVESVSVEHLSQLGAATLTRPLATVRFHERHGRPALEEIDLGSDGTVDGTAEVSYDASGRVISRKTTWAFQSEPEISTFTYCD